MEASFLSSVNSYRPPAGVASDDVARFCAAELEDEITRLGAPKRLGRLPGELNHYGYRPKGIAAVIAPKVPSEPANKSTQSMPGRSG